MSKRFPILMSAVLALLLLAVRADAKPVPVRLEPDAAVGAYMGLVEDHLAGILRTEKTIAVSREARSGRWDEVKPLLDRFSQDLPTDATVWLLMPDGSYYSTAKGSQTDQNLRDRSYFPKLMAGGEVLGELVISKSTGQRSIVVAAPVVVNGKVVAAVGVSVDAVLLAAQVESCMNLPENTYFYALDSNTKIVLHRYQSRMFRTVAEVSDESLGDAFRVVMNRDKGVFDYTLQGKSVRSVFRKSSLLGWYFFIARKGR